MTIDLERANRAIEALRKPDASLQCVPNTIRQSIAEVIENLVAGHHSTSERTCYDPTIQPYDDPLRHADRPAIGVEQMQRDLEQLRGMLEIERRLNSEHAAISVLPLEWKEHEQSSDEISYWADHQFGSYAVERDYFSVTPWELVAGGRVIGHFDSVEAAQSAAQKNFEQRVRSCLTSIRTKGAADEIERLRAALLPFAFETLPHTRRTLIDYDRNGLRRAISPMEVAARDAWRALKGVVSGSTEGGK